MAQNKSITGLTVSEETLQAYLESKIQAAVKEVMGCLHPAGQRHHRATLRRLRQRGVAQPAQPRGLREARSLAQSAAA